MEIQTSEFRRYLHKLITIALALILLEMTFVFFVDPYGIYDFAAEHPGLNAVKPRASRYQVEIKVTQARKLAPDVLILGNSRPEIGLDPEADSIVQHGLTAYNLAVPGRGTTTARDEIQFLLEQGLRPKQLIWALDFLDFMKIPARTPEKQPTTSEFDPNRFFWRFDSLFSLTSLSDAFRTILIQRRPYAESTTARGFNPLNDYIDLAAKEGYNKLFVQRARENLAIYRAKAQGTLDNGNFDLLTSVLEASARTGTKIELLIVPYHAQILLLFEGTSIWEPFVRWKKELAQRVAEVIRKYPDASITLYDFSGFSRYHCERIPAAGDLKTKTQWYWEIGHFKKALGDLMLRRVLAANSEEPGEVESGFGVRLTHENLNDNGSRIAEERAKCLKDYPELFGETQLLIRQTGASAS